ncbi:MAG: tryptophan--tRNA ligase [Armatimonadetes bacterium]|nr:tryptophan--tRNA ligase [Armatimonadota bacterium]
MAKRVFSGIQPTGAVHIGNYVGAIRNWVRLSEQHESYFSIVDLHAITVEYDPREMPVQVYECGLDLLAAGLDPERCVLFVQSYVPEHTELCWFFNTLTGIGALERMTQFKDKSEQHQQNVNVGLFDYPVLQAADILLYKADVVPVGEDQLQHLELSREIARRFNYHFGFTFPEPQPVLTPAARVMALNEPTRKMSKSVPGSFIGLADTDAAIRKKLGRAVTDAGPGEAGMSPGVRNLFTLLEAFAPGERVAHFQEQYDAGTLRYSELKPAVAEAICTELAPIRERRAALAENPNRVWEILDAGAERARTQARQTLAEVRERMGLRRK